jgi:hypothetical protein
MLAVVGKIQLSPYQHIARRMRSTHEVCYEGGRAFDLPHERRRDWTSSFGVYDFCGRLLAVVDQPATLAAKAPKRFTFRALMVDRGCGST